MRNVYLIRYCFVLKSGLKNAWFKERIEEKNQNGLNMSINRELSYKKKTVALEIWFSHNYICFPTHVGESNKNLIYFFFIFHKLFIYWVGCDIQKAKMRDKVFQFESIASKRHFLLKNQKNSITFTLRTWKQITLQKNGISTFDSPLILISSFPCTGKEFPVLSVFFPDCHNRHKVGTNWIPIQSLNINIFPILVIALDSP